MSKTAKLIAIALFHGGLSGCGGSSSSQASGNASASVTTSGSGTTGSSAGGVLDSGEGCTPGEMTQSGTLNGRYGSAKLSAGGLEYFLQVNQWNMESSGAQSMQYGGDTFFKMVVQDAEVPTNGGPTGYPSMFIGANSGHITDSGLPKQVAALASVPTSWTWRDAGTLSDSTSNSYNVAYDVWFSTQAAGEPDAYGPSGGYLMVWLYDPPDAQPIGGRPQYSGATVDGVPGTWDIWIGPNGNRPVISYVATEPVMSMSFDLNRFIRDAVANRADTILDSWYLTNVFGGFEIWRGGVGLETASFCVEVN